jgi:hypothetical protein
MTSALDRLPPVNEALLVKAMALAEASHWERDATKAGQLREHALLLYQRAHAARREAMYARGRA